MSWSLKLENGDLSISGSRIGIVTGKAKLAQDLRNWILEHMGTDDLHPGFGSLLDGGITPQGAVVPGVIGTDDLDVAEVEIRSEIQRIVSDYQSLQLARAKSDKLSYGRATMTPSEVLLSLDDIAIEQNMDTLKVTISISTASDDNFELQLTLTS
jgi:hypothetical protein